MIIIQLIGGLGNQLFQFALYYKLKTMGRKVKIDDISWYKIHNVETLRICDLGFMYEAAQPEDIIKYEDNSLKLNDRIRRKIIGSRDKIFKERTCNFDPGILELDDVCLVGYWQSEKYFLDVREELLKTVILVNKLDERNKKVLDVINSTNSVSIHVRAGDYKLPDLHKIYGDICTEDYYTRAISTIIKQISAPKFFVFSNDPVWAKQRFDDKDFIVVDNNDESLGYLDMYLMSQCKHNIIANSSFSWWGAWLNTNRNKIIIAPNKWLNTKEVTDIWCDSWIRV